LKKKKKKKKKKLKDVAVQLETVQPGHVSDRLTSPPQKKLTIPRICLGRRRWPTEIHLTDHTRDWGLSSSKMGVPRFEIRSLRSRHLGDRLLWQHPALNLRDPSSNSGCPVGSGAVVRSPAFRFDRG
jgi:hypothetical protein